MYPSDCPDNPNSKFWPLCCLAAIKKHDPDVEGSHSAGSAAQICLVPQSVRETLVCKKESRMVLEISKIPFSTVLWLLLLQDAVFVV